MALERLKRPWPDHRAERALGAVSLLVGVGVVAMVVFVATRAWPIFQHNGLSWVLGGGDLEAEINKMTAATTNPAASIYHLRAWPLIYGTLLTHRDRGGAGHGDRGALLDLHRRAGAGAGAAGW